jgi:hypothetical protein
VIATANLITYRHSFTIEISKAHHRFWGAHAGRWKLRNDEVENLLMHDLLNLPCNREDLYNFFLIFLGKTPTVMEAGQLSDIVAVTCKRNDVEVGT